VGRIPSSERGDVEEGGVGRTPSSERPERRRVRAPDGDGGRRRRRRGKARRRSSVKDAIVVDCSGHSIPRLLIDRHYWMESATNRDR